MHVNSIIAYKEQLKKLTGRKMMVYGHLAQQPLPTTDRAVKDALFNSQADMNMVRPRISDLIAEGWVIETGKVLSRITKKPNRLVRALTCEERVEIDAKMMEDQASGQEELDFEKQEVTLTLEDELLEVAKMAKNTFEIFHESGILDDLAPGLPDCIKKCTDVINKAKGL